MKILHVLGTPNLGGAQRLVLNVSTAATAAGLQWRTVGTAFALSRTGPLLREFLEIAPTYYLPLASPPGNFQPIYRAQRVLRQLGGRLDLIQGASGLAERVGADIMHVHYEPILPWILIAARHGGLRVLFTLHAGISHLRAIEVALVKKVLANERVRARFVAVSGEARKLISKRYGVPESDIAIVRNGVHVRDVDLVKSTRDRLRQELGLSYGDFVIGSVSRLLHSKRLDMILDTVALLRRRNLPIKAIIAGDGPERAALVSQVAGLGLQEHVVLPGQVEDGASWLSALDAFILPSETEGLPIAMLEAASVGVPIIARNVGDVPRFLADGARGIVLEDVSVEILADHVCRLIEEPTLAEAYVERARASLLDGWSSEACAKAYNSQYELLLS